MNDIQIFNNEQFGEVRIAMNESNEPMFCLADVCTILGLRQGDVRQRLDDGVVSTQPIIDSLGREQQANFVNEDGLYDTILDSRKPEAKAFRKWVTGEILPSIRKHGVYATPETIDTMISDPDNAIKVFTALKQERQQRRLAESKAQLLEQITKEQAPKVLFANAIVASESSILIGRLAIVLKQSGVDIGQNRLFNWMREHEYLCKSGERYNQPTQAAMDMGIFEVSYNTVVRPDKSIQTITTKVTGKGQVYFVNKFLGEKTNNKED